MTTPTTLQLLGGFSLTVDGERRAVAARKVKALLARLAVKEATLPRDQLAALLWPDSSSAAARHSLRQALSELRRVLDGSGLSLIVTADEVALHPETAHIDTRAFLLLGDSQQADDRARAMALYNGALLEGLELRLDTFDGWLAECRAEFADSAMRLCRALADQDDDHAEEAMGWYKRLLGLDPLDEAAHRDLMRLQIAAGQDGAAIRQYLHCRALLARELDIEPETETTALYESLLTHRARAGPAPDGDPPLPARPPAAEPSVGSATRQPAARALVDDGRRLRPAVVASVQVDVDERDPEQADLVWQERLALLSRVVRSFGGRVVAQIGRQAVCGFGLGRVRGTEADRACLAAAELVDRLPEARAGIASGQVIYRPQDGSLIGQATSEAQALCARARVGEVLLSDAVAGAQRASGTAAPGPDGTLRLLPGEVADGGAPLVGRNLEIGQFMALLDASRDGGYGGAMLIRGEAGIGKTRLVNEFGTLAAQENFRVHAGRIYDFGSARGQDATAQLVRSLLGARSATEAALDGRFDPLHVPFLLTILDADPGPDAADQIASLSAQERLERSCDAVIGLVRGAARDNGLVLLVEDLHWADRLTLFVLPRLARALSELPVVMLMTSRVAGEALDPDWRAAMGGAALVTVDLQPLRRADAGRLANALGADQQGLAELLERAGGNPLFIEQLVRSERRRSVPARLAGRHDELPITIQSLAVAQLEALPQAAQTALRGASVLGQRFAGDVLTEVLGAEPELNDAVEAGLIARLGERGAAAAGDWGFHHALIRDGIYHNILPSERRALHERAGRYFEARSLSLCAQHLDLADADDAADALLRAAEDEIRHYRLARSRELVDRVLAREPGNGRGLLLNAELELLAGSTARAAEAYRECLSVAAETAQQARALVGLGMALNQLDDFDGAVEALREAVTLNREDAAYQADAWLQLGNALFPQGLTEQCLEAHETALTHAERADSTLCQARAEGGLGDAYYQQGAMLTAHRHFDRCVALGETHGHPSVVPANQAMRALSLMYQNRLVDALADGRSALARAEASSNLRHQLLAHNVLGSIESFHGDVDQGLNHALRTVELGQRIGSRRFVVDGLAQIAHLLWSAGRVEDARHAIDQVLEHLDVSLMPFAGAYVRGLQALCAVTAGERHAHLAAGERLLSGAAVSHCHIYFRAAAIEACLVSGELERALHFADGLTGYTAPEPLPFTELFIRAARSRAGADGAEPAAELAAEARAVELPAVLRLLDV